MAQRTRGRFAPSPSGEMHLGNAWSAVLAWLSARNQGGEMVLRLEDLDPQRCRPAYGQQVMADLAWLGLDWVGDPVEQSQRAPLYQEAYQFLAQKHQIYPCYCTRGERLAASAPHQGEGVAYPGSCRLHPPTDPNILARRPSYRISVPDREILPPHSLDRVGIAPQNLAKTGGDVVLRRGDGVFAYHLAVVVDDALMGVTQVVRGQDLRSATPLQVWLCQELGYAVPEYGHVPLLLAQDGRRLAKREGDLALSALKESLSPQAVLGRLAHLAGWLERLERISLAELETLFSWETLPREDLVVGEE